jgi:hypothetical protein
MFSPVTFTYNFEFLYILKIILQKYTTVCKFYTFDNHSPWSTAAAVAHDLPLWATSVRKSPVGPHGREG